MKRKYKILIISFLIFTLSITKGSSLAKALHENSYIVADYSSGNILMQKDANKKVYPASTTKVLTCILALENLNLSDSITVTKEMLKEVPSGSSTMKLVANDKMTVKDLLYGLMLPSGNDAAIVVAHLVSSSTENFAELMNKKVKELGCTNTHFTNPHGFHDENHYTTASDMLKIFSYALQNETFLEILSTSSYTIKANEAVSYDRKYTSTNMLIKNSPYIVYGKTGYTEEAGNVFISYINYNDYKIIAVLLDGDKSYYNIKFRFDDTLSIHKYIFDNYKMNLIIPKQNIKVEVIDRSLKTTSIYSNENDIKMLTNSNRFKAMYDLEDNTFKSNKISLSITGENYYLNEYTTNLINIQNKSVLNGNIDKNIIKIILFVLLDIICLLIFVIMIFMIVRLVNSKKRKKIRRTHYNRNLYR